MQKEERIAQLTIDELKRRAESRESGPAWRAVDQLSDEDIERLAQEDEEENGPHSWDGHVYRGLPPGIGTPKKQLTVRLDPDVVEWFKSQGKGYQTRMNAVLRQYMEHEKSRSSS